MDQIDIHAAQQSIAKDWIGASKKYVGAEPTGSSSFSQEESPATITTPPARSEKTTKAPTNSPSATTLSGEIIGNQRSHIYH